MGILAKINGRFAIGTRIGTGFALMLAIIGTIGFLGWNALTNGKDGLLNYSAVSQNTVRVGDIAEGFVALRRYLYIQGVEPSPDTARRIETLDASVRKDLDAAIASIHSAERRAIAQEIRTGFDEYMRNAKRAAELRDARDNAVVRGMNPLGQQGRIQLTAVIESTIAAGEFRLAAYVGAAQEALALARINALRYLNQADPALIEAFDRSLRTFGAAIERAAQAASGERRPQIESTREIVTRYGAAFRQAVEADRA